MSLADQPFELLCRQEQALAQHRSAATAASATTGKASRRTLDGQLLPLAQGYWLLPQAGVLETCAISEVRVATGGPGWLLGFVDRQGVEIPVISFEAMRGGAVPVRSPRTRIAVINSVGTGLVHGQFAVVIQGAAHRIPLTPRVLKKRSPPAAAGIAAQVSIANREAMIPDLEGIEQQLSHALARLV